LNDLRDHPDNLVLRLEMAFERADSSHCLVRGKLAHPGLPRHRRHNLYPGNVRGENVVSCLRIRQAPHPETPGFIGITLDEGTAIEIVGSHQRRSSMMTSESGFPCT